MSSYEGKRRQSQAGSLDRHREAPRTHAPEPRLADKRPEGSRLTALQALADTSPRVLAQYNRVQALSGNPLMPAVQQNMRQSDPSSSPSICQPRADTVDQPVQRQIKGGSKAVYRMLEKNPEWKSFIGNGSKKAMAYSSALDAMLEQLASMETAFDAEHIAEAIRVSGLDTASVAAAKAIVMAPLEEHIDEHVLSSGHSGEKHYGKDEKYQKERMKLEKKKKVTTLEDSARTKKLFTYIQNTVEENLFKSLNLLVYEVADKIAVDPLNVVNVNSVASTYIGRQEDFEQYFINLEKIDVRGRGGGDVYIRIQPKLQSLLNFPKTEYNLGSDSQSGSAPIVMYWGGNSPALTIQPADIVLGNANAIYNTLYNKLKEQIKRPVTAF